MIARRSSLKVSLNRISLGFLVLSCSGYVAQSQELYKMDGKSVKATDLNPALLQNLFEIEMSAHRNKKALAEEAMLEAHFAGLVKSGGKSAAELQDEALKPKDPTEAEQKKFYEENKDRIPPNMTYDQVKGEIKKVLQQQGQGKVREALIAKVAKQHGFTFTLPEPVAPTVQIKTEGRMVKGTAQAKVTVIEFADFACGHCRKAHPDVKKLIAELGSTVQYIFIDFVLGNPDARKIALGSYCAAKQNKYWEFQDLGFTKPVTAQAALDHAKALKLNEKDFATCSDSKEAKDFIDSARAEGERVGVNGTPAFFINGKRYMGAPEYADLKAAIKAVK